MGDLQRETLGSIARIAEQMSYTAMNGMTETLKVQFETMKKQMAKLDMVGKYIKKEA